MAFRWGATRWPAPDLRFIRRPRRSRRCRRHRRPRGSGDDNRSTSPIGGAGTFRPPARQSAPWLGVTAAGARIWPASRARSMTSSPPQASFGRAVPRPGTGALRQSQRARRSARFRWLPRPDEGRPFRLRKDRPLQKPDRRRPSTPRDRKGDGRARLVYGPRAPSEGPGVPSAQTAAGASTRDIAEGERRLVTACAAPSSPSAQSFQHSQSMARADRASALSIAPSIGRVKPPGSPSPRRHQEHRSGRPPARRRLHRRALKRRPRLDASANRRTGGHAILSAAALTDALVRPSPSGRPPCRRHRRPRPPATTPTRAPIIVGAPAGTSGRAPPTPVVGPSRRRPRPREVAR